MGAREGQQAMRGEELFGVVSTSRYRRQAVVHHGHVTGVVEVPQIFYMGTISSGALAGDETISPRGVGYLMSLDSACGFCGRVFAG